MSYELSEFESARRIKGMTKGELVRLVERVVWGMLREWVDPVKEQLGYEKRPGVFRGTTCLDRPAIGINEKVEAIMEHLKIGVARTKPTVKVLKRG